MFFNIDGIGDFYDVQIKVYVGTQLLQHRSLSAPDQMLAMHFLQLCQQAAQQKDPYKVEMIRYEPTYDQFEDKTVNKEYKMTYWNKQETW